MSPRTRIRLFCILVLLLATDKASSSSATPATMPSVAAANTGATQNGALKIVFSDLDGTLIHYPVGSGDDDVGNDTSEANTGVLEFPPSSTGLKGVISTKTLSLVRTIRKGGNSGTNVKFVLVSGMRTPTLLQRLPYLPRADAYCSENGGRIFYPIGSDEDGGENGNGHDDVFWVTPHRFRDEGNDKHSDDDGYFRPFGIREDLDWKRTMEEAMTGIHEPEDSHSYSSFGSAKLQQVADDPSSPASTVPLEERSGLLWDLARELATKGIATDIKGYATCFRVNQKQQSNTANRIDQLALLLEEPPWNAATDGNRIVSSVNLKCVDFYPSCSGKKNCCLYLAKKFFPEDCAAHGRSSGGRSAPEDFLSRHAVCLCDDDNDLEMALACSHAYLPDVSSATMGDAIQNSRYEGRFTVTRSSSIEGINASDLALETIVSDRL